MKIFAIKDNNQKDIGYVFYFEKNKEFYIELQNNLSEWDVPLLLSTFYKRKIYSINSYWSKIWISQRIVPQDRQNLGQILKDNKLKCYDEYDLLMLSNGKCEQDEYYLKNIEENNLPKEILERLQMRVEDVQLVDNNLLVIFRNKEIKLFDLNSFVNNNANLLVLKNNFNYIKNFKISTGGFGVYWDYNIEISYVDLYHYAKKIDVNSDVFINYIKHSIISTSEVMDILNCSRQYINELVKTNKLIPLKSTQKTTLFLKSDVNKLNWN